MATSSTETAVAFGYRGPGFSPRMGTGAAPVNLPTSSRLSSGTERNPSLILGHLLSSSTVIYQRTGSQGFASAPSPRARVARRRRSHSGDRTTNLPGGHKKSSRKPPICASAALAKTQSRNARKLNDSLVYLEGPQIYACGQCRTHLTSHDEIISKSFHGRHGRAYLFDNCVNVTIGPAEDRPLITGLHSVCDIFCKRCKHLVGWTYAKAYEASQKYKEGKYIIEKINLHLEESDYYNVAPPAGERKDRFRARSISWGSESSSPLRHDMVYEYSPSSPVSSPRKVRDRKASCYL